MRGLIKAFDRRTQRGIILFGVDTEFPFNGDSIRQPVFLSKGDPVIFDLKDQDGTARAYDVRIERFIHDGRG